MQSAVGVTPLKAPDSVPHLGQQLAPCDVTAHACVIPKQGLSAQLEENSTHALALHAHVRVSTSMVKRLVTIERC